MGQFTNKSTSKDWHAAWAGVRERLRRELGDPVFDAWIGPLTLEGFDKDELRIGAAKPFVRNWVTNHYVARIERAFRAEGAEPASLTIVLVTPQPAVGGGLAKEPVRTELPAAPVSYLPKRAAKNTTAPIKGLWNRMLHPQQTFDSFIPGTRTNSAMARRALSPKASGADVPLLYIHGGFGLRQDASAECRGAGIPQARQARVVPPRRGFHAPFPGRAVRKDTLSFKDELRTADVLIIDDLQHICRSTATASEFLYTVNAFADLRRRVVIAADRAPSALEGLGADVKSRA